MVNTFDQTYKNAKRFAVLRRYKKYGMCLQWCREMADIGRKYDDAIGSANHAKPLKGGIAPRGAFHYFANKGQGEHGHISIAAGGVKTLSTDIKVRSRVNTVTIQYICDKWNMRYLGWSDECNDVRLKPNPSVPGNYHLKSRKPVTAYKINSNGNVVPRGKVFNITKPGVKVTGRIRRVNDKRYIVTKMGNYYPVQSEFFVHNSTGTPVKDV